MKKKSLLIICLITVLVLSLVGACAKPAPAPAPAPAPTPKEPIVLKAIAFKAKTAVDPQWVTIQKFFDRVNERAKGELEIKYLGAKEVCPVGEQMEAVSKGVFELVHTAAYHTSAVPEAASLMLSELKPWEERESGYYDLIDKAHQEQLNVKFLGRSSTNDVFFLYSNVRIHKLEDFEGLTFRSNSTYDPFLDKLGLDRIFMSGGEIYTAMERGLIDGFPSPRSLARYSLEEVTKYRIDHAFWPPGTTSFYINLDAWENLPPHLQKLLVDVMKEVELEEVEVMAGFSDAEDKRQLAGGMEFIKLGPVEGEQLGKIGTEAKWVAIYKDLGQEKARILQESITKK